MTTTYIVLMGDEAQRFNYAVEAKNFVFSGHDMEATTAILELHNVAVDGKRDHGIFEDVTEAWAREIAASLSDADIRAGVWVHPLVRPFVREVPAYQPEDVF